MNVRDGVRLILESIKDKSTVREGSTVTTSVPTGTVTNVMSVTLLPGTYLLTGHFVYGGGFPQNCAYYISCGSEVVTVRGSGTQGGGASLSHIVTLTSQTTCYLAAYQASGSTRTVTTRFFRAIKI